MVLKPVLHISGSDGVFFTQSGDDITLGRSGGKAPQPSVIRTMATDWDEEELARGANMHDGPQQYNFEPARREGANEELPRTKENEWRVRLPSKKHIGLTN